MTIPHRRNQLGGRISRICAEAERVPPIFLFRSDTVKTPRKRRSGVEDHICGRRGRDPSTLNLVSFAKVFAPFDKVRGTRLAGPLNDHAGRGLASIDSGNADRFPWSLAGPPETEVTECSDGRCAAAIGTLKLRIKTDPRSPPNHSSGSGTGTGRIGYAVLERRAVPIMDPLPSVPRNIEKSISVRRISSRVRRLTDKDVVICVR